MGAVQYVTRMENQWQDASGLPVQLYQNGGFLQECVCLTWCASGMG